LANSVTVSDRTVRLFIEELSHCGIGDDVASTLDDCEVELSNDGEIDA
jgi:hypothetical protein